MSDADLTTAAAEALWASTPAPAVVLDIDGVVVAANPRAQSLLPDDAPVLPREGGTLDLGDRRVRFEATPLPGGGTLLHGLDVTAERELLARMSHELRTPLNAILGFAQLLELRAGEEDQADVRQIVAAGRLLLDLINDVLDLARLDAGSMDVSLKPIDVRLVVDAVAGHDADFEVASGTPDHVWARGDPLRLEQVLRHLVTHAGPHGARVVVAIDVIDGEVLLSVTDFGPGMTDQELAVVFESFERMASDPTGEAGTGLGLPLALGLTVAMGGRLDVISEPGSGSCFTVALPAASQSDRAASGRREDASTTGVVLYIEDNASNLKLVEMILRLRPGVELRQAIDGRSGLAAAAAGDVDLVLLDMNLPDMDGEEVIAALRRVGASEHVPVVSLTADATAERQARLLRLGLHARLTKPLEIGRFLAIVDDVLHERPRP